MDSKELYFLISLHPSVLFVLIVLHRMLISDTLFTKLPLPERHDWQKSLTKAPFVLIWNQSESGNLTCLSVSEFVFA